MTHGIGTMFFQCIAVRRLTMYGQPRIICRVSPDDGSTTRHTLTAAGWQGETFSLLSDGSEPEECWHVTDAASVALLEDAYTMPAAEMATYAAAVSNG